MVAAQARLSGWLARMPMSQGLRQDRRELHQRVLGEHGLPCSRHYLSFHGHHQSLDTFTRWLLGRGVGGAIVARSSAPTSSLKPSNSPAPVSERHCLLLGLILATDRLRRVVLQ